MITRLIDFSVRNRFLVLVLAAASAAIGAWSLRNPVLYTLLWIVVIIGVFAPLAVHRSRTSGRR